MLGIIIANWNGEKLIEKCLESLSKQKFTEFKIYIVDNASKDNSKEIINNYKKKLEIELTELDYNSGFAVANNIGIKQAIQDKCEYILTLNNDVEVPKECLMNAMEQISKQKLFDIFQLFMINYYDRDKCDAAGLEFDKKLFAGQVGYKEDIKEVLKRKVEIDGACAGAAIYSSKALKKVELENGDYFDSNFFAYYEDVDLALRLKRAGFKTNLIKESIVYHMHSATGNKTNGFKEYYLARNLLLYTKRNQRAERLKEVQYSYYVHLVKVIMKNITKLSVIKSVFKGVKSGRKEMKLIEYIEYK
ncbi:MAG: glycosyltransferase family 2 protein [Romboutsia sp.]|uniref:glycosyltransferase family 2 protein n=1 Tax=Romboutsia sp. TaxID=1965302 RepID=UPI003F2D0FED